MAGDEHAHRQGSPSLLLHAHLYLPLLGCFQGRVPGTSMLVRNYRSHRRLLDLPSKLFYQAGLSACPAGFLSGHLALVLARARGRS